MEVSREYAVQMHGITKRFGAFTALDKVDLDVRKGTIHAVLGENGAGKSTLMNVLYGLYQAEEGEIFLYGEKTAIRNPGTAIRHGIGMVHQHFMLVDNFTVLQNIVLGREVSDVLGFLKEKEARKKVEEISRMYGLEIDPDAYVSDISVGMQQRIEILKALYRGAEILILDEPTAVLTPQEIQELIGIMNNLTKNGKTVIIITHKLKEIKSCASECTVIRRGVYVDTVNVEDVTQEELAAKMVGHAVSLVVDKKEACPGEVIFEIDGLKVKDERGLDAVKNLSLKIRKGEIYGIAGIDGNGQKELVEAITGLSRAVEGKILVGGQEIQNTSPANVIAHKVAAIHEDRQKRGLVLDFTVKENMILEKNHEEPFASRGILNWKKIADYTKEMIRTYDIRPENCTEQPARGLSGGNQQKIIIAREISGDPDVMIAVQPTRGLDVGAIEYVHKALISQRDKGKAVLLISLELDEVMHVADTIGVLYGGTIVRTFRQEEADEITIGYLMAGGTDHAENS